MSKSRRDIIKEAILKEIICEEGDWQIIGIVLCDAGCEIGASIEEDKLMDELLNEFIIEGRVEIEGDISDSNNSYVRLRTEEQKNRRRV